jgi:hypothetical protein
VCSFIIHQFIGSIDREAGRKVNAFLRLFYTFPPLVRIALISPPLRIAPKHEDLPVIAGHLALAVNQHGRVELSVPVILWHIFLSLRRWRKFSSLRKSQHVFFRVPFWRDLLLPDKIRRCCVFPRGQIRLGIAAA